MDKDSEMIKMIQDEFGQHLNIDQLVAPSGNANFQQSGRDTRKDEKGHLSRSFSGDPDTEQDKGRISGDFGIARKPDQFKCQFITENGFKVHIVEENITKVKADVIVCPQDHRCQSKGQIAKAIEEVSDSAYRNDMYTMKSVTKCENRRYKASPYTLPFRYVLHTVPPLFDNNAARDRAKFAREIALTIRNIIRHCSDSSGISSVAIPVLGVGIEGNVTPYGTFVSTLATQIVKESQSEKFKLQEIFIVIHDSAIASTIASNFDKEEGFKKVTSFQRLRKRQNKDSTEGQKSDDGNGAKTKSSERLGTTVTGGNLDDCVICMDKPEDPRKLKCGHIFCQGCIGQHFKLNNPVCPTCGSIQGELTGNQPPGTMKVYRFSSSLSGYPHCGRIVIDYDIPGGYQGKEHKTPGRSYEGIRRSGYLPDNGKGQLVAKMLRIAFDRKMVFTIGDSRTTGKQGVVTWNDIHHKTNPNPHGQFGYPDETYLDRVIDELSAKGITEQDVGPDTKLY